MGEWTFDFDGTSSNELLCLLIWGMAVKGTKCILELGRNIK